MNAPVVLFVYSRYDHTKEVLYALSKNDEARNSDLYIFSDAAKNDAAIEKVRHVRDLIHDPIWKDCFQNVYIIERDRNFGLAKSIITGVSDILKKYKKVIVIEDDSVSMPGFLTYMNQALEFYKKNNKIWSIGGYSFLRQSDFPSTYSDEVYVIQRTCSYAWATWIDRWEMVDWTVEDYNKFKWDFINRYKFNRVGNNHAVMLDAQMKGRIDSWAIRFCYSMFKNNMLTIYPRWSYIRNIGEDGTGVHFNKKRNNVEIPLDIAHKKEINLTDVSEDKLITKAFAKHPAVHLPPLKLLFKYIKNR